MDFLRIFQTAVLVGLGIIATACHQSRQPLESGKAAAQAEDDNLVSRYARATEASVVGTGLDAYIGEIFSSEQNALASKSPDADAPTY
jgi:hypothetical protein